MLQKMIWICLCLCLFSLGCSEVPKPTSHNFTTQKKIQATSHWNVIAEDIGADIFNVIKQKNTSNPSIAFFPNNNSPFCRAFRSFLGTYFVNSGIDIKEIDNADYQLDWSVQVIKHEGERVSSDGFPAKNTVFAMLGYGVYKIVDSASVGAGIIGGVAALDLIHEFYKTEEITLPKNELLINVSLVSSNNYQYRSSNIYYLNDLDTNHYYDTRDPIGVGNKFNQKTFSVSD